jgi:serine/threonine protein phosphatase 1
MELAQNITGPVAVIGDVHGQLPQLENLLAQLAAREDFERRWIVFIGDLVDRGLDSKGVLDRILKLMHQHERTTIVCGNHDFALAAALKFVNTPEYCDWAARWLDHYGAGATFRSYGVDEVGNLEKLAAAVPEEHRQLLACIPWCVEHPEYFFVHAGLDPNASFFLQQAVLRERDFSLTRPQWLCSKSLTFQEPPRDCTRVVVSGHTQVPHVTFGHKRILIDTSGGEGGTLSCVLLPENRILHSDPSTVPMKASLSPPEPEAKKKSWLW